jgi:subtilisin
MQTMSAKEVDSSRPKYLIVFSEAEEKNTSTLSTVLKRGKSKEVPERKGISMIAAGESGVHAKVYERLGVAAADLSKAQYNALCKRDDVVAVVENEVRFLPPVRRSVEEEDDGKPSAAGEKSELITFMKGVRATAELVLSFLEGGRQISNQALLPELEAVTPAAVSFEWGLKAIGVANAVSPPTGKGVKVAVLDTGLDLEHPDFKGRVVEGDTAQSFVTGVSVQDRHGHGTHCAGIVCGPRKSVSGRRYSVAPDATLLVGKVFNNEFRPKATDDDILEGIAWADGHGARVISMSLGSVRDVDGKFPPQYEQIARKLLGRKSNSIFLVAAAGNESDRPASTAPVGNPAACPSIMAVAAVDKNKHVAFFSCKQMDDIGILDVSGPGVAIFSSFTNGSFETLDGTSMATPFVAGLAALYLQREPKLTAQKLFDELKKRAKKLGDVNDFGTGLVQL